MIEPSLTRVYVRDLCVFGFHGVLPEERKLGQRFYVTLTIAADLSAAVEGDEYHKSVCYAALCQLVEDHVAGPPCHLIETLAHRIASAVLARHKIVQNVTVELRKPSAPMDHALKEAAVCVHLERRSPIGLSLGANQGACESVLRAAVDRLSCHQEITISSVSSLYKTAPWGVEDQPPFFNLCLLGETTLRPHALLSVCKELEFALGRVPGRRWGERVLDIDLLFHGETCCNDRVLTVPHCHMFVRPFVLLPLLEIAPELEVAGRSVRQALEECPRQEGDVVLYTEQLPQATLEEEAGV